MIDVLYVCGYEVVLMFGLDKDDLVCVNEIV